MNLSELQLAVNNAISYAIECHVNPDEIDVSLQIDGPETHSVFTSDDVELHYDNDLSASGCVLTANRDGGIVSQPDCRFCTQGQASMMANYCPKCGRFLHA